MILESLPTVSEAASSSARFARSGFIWGWKYFLQNMGMGVLLGKSGAERCCSTSARNKAICPPRQRSALGALLLGGALVFLFLGGHQASASCALRTQDAEAWCPQTEKDNQSHKKTKETPTARTLHAMHGGWVSANQKKTKTTKKRRHHQCLLVSDLKPTLFAHFFHENHCSGRHPVVRDVCFDRFLKKGRGVFVKSMVCLIWLLTNRPSTITQVVPCPIPLLY